MSDLAVVFEKLKERGEGALIGYVTGGDPDPSSTPRIAESLAKGGVDILELGIPFSDPIADGPVIQAASNRSLNAGTTPRMVLEMAREIENKKRIPIVILTYFNSVFKMGINDFFQFAKTCHVDGVVVPDLPIEEALYYRNAASINGVDTIFLAAPSTSNERLEKIAACTSGFLYLVSHFGVTGEKERMEESTVLLVKRMTKALKGKIPIAVGFGISKPEHVRSLIQAGADGVIVGSAFVNLIQRNLGNLKQITLEIEETARRLKAATVRKSTFAGEI